MQFLIIGKDGKDNKAMERRITVRESHLKLGDEMEILGERKFNRPQSFFETRNV